jgi:retron-type reverse transcriptase
VSQGLERVREAAKQRKKERFTALLHHVTVDLLKDAYFWLKREAAPGVDGRTWQSYKQDLEVNLGELHSRIHRGTYRALPSRRRYIPKPDGRQRPLGVAALEDKIVQRAVVEVLNTIYEEDFLGFSYGFRPGRGQHDALDALAVGITRTKVNWIVDADIAGFFDAVSHEWLMRFVEHRIGDRRINRLIRKWLKAGVMEEGKLVTTETGTPQGAVASPPDSYGYRPFKSAHDAVGQARKRCWKYDWVLDLDIKGFFDNIPHELLMRAVRKHAPEKWVVLYVERWLKAPAQNEQGQLTTREKGTPQGGVASCWQTFSYTTASMRGWRARTQASPLRGLPMMPSCIAERRRKLKACARRSSCGWLNADWSLTSRKPKSFIARMRIGEERMSTRSLPSWAMSSDPGGLETTGGNTS